MRKPIAFIIAFLLVAPIIVAIAVGQASAKDIVTIPLNESVQISPNLKANLIQITISDTTYGGSFAEDQSKVIFPILVYNYQNVGSVPETGHLHVKFVDDQGEVYDATDPGTMDPIQPGKTGANRPLEINIPKDRKVTSLVVVQGFNQQTIPLVYPGSASPTSTPAPSGTASGTPGGLCLGSLILPLTIVGMAWAGMRLSRKQP
jgi:hypothetical protein